MGLFGWRDLILLRARGVGLVLGCVLGAAGWAQAPVDAGRQAGPPKLMTRRGPPPVRQAYESDKKYIRAVADAEDAERRGMYNLAIGFLLKANTVAGGRCHDCLQQAYDLQMKVKDYKAAVVSGAGMAGLAADAGARSLAEVEQARAMEMMAAGKQRQAQLEAAHAEYQAAITDFPTNISAHYLDGTLLARLGRMAEASRQFAVCADAASPGDPARMRVRRFVKDPGLSLLKMAPAFTVTTLDGSTFTLDEYVGKVVLIAFWSTGCGSCTDDVVEIQKIAREFAGQPLVILSISWDTDDAAWRAYVKKNAMTWPQYRDAKRELTNGFGVVTIPQYFAIDGDGAERTETVGPRSDVEQQLRKMLAKATAK
jgi:peroxiredoxin